MIGGVAGIVAGFYNVYKVAVRLQKSDAEQRVIDLEVESGQAEPKLQDTTEGSGRLGDS